MPAKSPFPGMDPYLERYWENVHARMIGYLADAVAEQLPDDLAARIEERVYVDAGDYPVPYRKPDFRVVEHLTGLKESATHPAALLVAEPVTIRMAREPVTERLVEILDLDGNRVVTAIELLSPTNKATDAGRKAYLRKREEFVEAGVNLVEIDLVRAGDWLTILSAYHVPRPYRTTYRVSVARAPDYSEAKLYPITLQQKLPGIALPLRTKDADVRLDLQALLDRTYQYSRLDTIDYKQPCEPPLEGEDEAWAKELLKAVGRS